MKIIKVSSFAGASEALPTVSNFGGSYYFDANFSYLEQIVAKDKTFVVTDTHVFESNQQLFQGWQTIVLPAGEEHKQQATVDFIIGKLIAGNADRTSFIVGVGGGVVTDITGYAASIYMRGVKFGFVPTTILAMVDASIGGKNGVGPHLNGVVGRARGSVEGFAYSDAMKSIVAPWTEEEIYTFIKAPKVYVPGTKMSYAGLAKPEERANVVAYLASLK